MHDGLKSEIGTRHLQGYSELTLAAPIRRGFVASLDSRSYATRLRMAMDTLHTLRTTSREYSLIRPFSDSTDRIRTINSLRMWVQEPEHKLVLSVGFDRPWESYLRIIWRDVGTLLDVIFCNCDGYPVSSECSFETYGRWITDARTDTRFFYNNGNLTVDDLQYLKQAERLQREGVPLNGAIDPGCTDLALAGLVAEDPEKLAQKVATASFLNRVETVTQGMQALSVVYRLADVYPPGTRDGDILLRAARQLLRELSLAQIRPMYGPATPAGLRFRMQIEWFQSTPTPPPAPSSDRAFDRPGDVQGGIVSDYPAPLTHGCVLLVAVRDAAGAAAFLARLKPDVTLEQRDSPPGDGVYLNIAFSHEGLKKLGVSEARLEAFPVEFREGMEARAGLLGDVRTNHPGHWALPLRNWPAPASVNGLPARVPMAAVHIVVQMVCQAADAANDDEIVGNPAHPLHAKVTALMAGASGVELLSVQALRRRFGDPASVGGAAQVRDHFGFIDGISQPQVGGVPQVAQWSNFVARGDVLIGYENTSGDLPTHDALLHNGSFLVVRKLRQHVDALDACLAAAATTTGLGVDALKSRMLGRDVVSAAPLATGIPLDNAFDYANDPQGAACPLQSHIRRANPRSAPQPADPPDPRAPLGRQVIPRLVRRGMSYGPRVAPGAEDAERGILFMAYNASIGEQFEVVQRWISGGNSSGACSAEADPLLGVPAQGDPRTFRFHDGAKVTRMQLDDPQAPESRPFVRLEWGAYLFAPSLPALDQLMRIAQAPPAPPTLEIEGAQIIEEVLRLERQLPPQDAVDAWKEVLEDSTARKTRRAQAVWAAVRGRHGGVLRTAYGVLVGRKDLVTEVFADPHDRYTVKGYRERMVQSFGEIYLGLDKGIDYSSQATRANQAILGIRIQPAFELARDRASAKLHAMIATAKAIAAHIPGNTKWELTFDIKELSDQVLADVNRAWFDLPDETHVMTGGWSWDIDVPTCPGHFTAPSRYIFQPNPGPMATRYGQAHGAAVLPKVRAFIAARRQPGAAPLTGIISKPLFDAAPDTPAGNDLLARTLIGIMMGYLPTVEANLRATLHEWLEERTLWDLQAALLPNPDPNPGTAIPFAQAKQALLEPLKRTMQLRPLPELTWRIAAAPHRLGSVDIRYGDKVVVGIVSAMQQGLADPPPADEYPVFGGDRRNATTHTHACPGHEAGMGVLLGILTALLAAGALRSTPAALTLRLRGRLP